MKSKPSGSGLLSLLFLFFSLSLFAQKKTITGKVIEQETGQPLAGVSIAVKGSATTVVSNNLGAFSIVVSSKESVLEISYVGYETQEVEVGGQATVTVSMLNANKQLNDVVVIGYGTQKKSNVTGAVTTLKTKTLMKEPLPVLIRHW